MQVSTFLAGHRDMQATNWPTLADLTLSHLTAVQPNPKCCRARLTAFFANNHQAPGINYAICPKK